VSGITAAMRRHTQSIATWKNWDRPEDLEVHQPNIGGFFNQNKWGIHGMF